MNGIGQIVEPCQPDQFIQYFGRGQVVLAVIYFEEHQLDITDLACQVLDVRQDIGGDDIGACAQTERE